MDAVDELKEEMLEAVIRPFCGHCLADNCRLYHVHPDYSYQVNRNQRVDSFCVVYRCNRCVPCQFAKDHVPYIPLMFDEHTGIIVQTYWSRRREYRRFLSMPEAHPGAKFHWCGLSNQWSNRRRKPR